MTLTALPFIAFLGLTFLPNGTSSPQSDRSTAYESLAARLGLVDSLTGTVKCGFPVLAFGLRDTALQGELRPVVLLDRPTTQADLVRGPFRVHFDTTGPQAPALLDALYRRIPGTSRLYADSVAEIANAVLAVECGTLGYDVPPSDGGAGGGEEYDIYIQELENLYGVTTPESALPGRRYVSFLTLDNDYIFVRPDSNKGLPALRVTVAHEFHHAIQLGGYGYWGFDDIAFHEMSSTWMEDAVYPDVNDYFAYLVSAQGHFRRPEAPFLANDIIMYSRAIWCHYLAARFGAQVIRSAWEWMRSTTSVPALDAALSSPPAAGGFRGALAEWTLWNFFTGFRAVEGEYYPEGKWWPPVVQRAFWFSPPSRVIADSLPTTGARYHQILYAVDTLTLALVNITDVLAGGTGSWPYAYLLDTERRDPGYKETAAGIFVKLDVPDPAGWFSWDIVDGGVSPPGISDGLVFPNPFRPSSPTPLSIAVPGTAAVEGTLSVYTSAMDLIHRAGGTSVSFLGKQVFQWNGRKENSLPVESGIYLFVLEIPGNVLRGKIAVLQE